MGPDRHRRIPAPPRRILNTSEGHFGNRRPDGGALARVQPGITIIDVPVDYTRNTELFAQLHEGVLG